MNLIDLFRITFAAHADKPAIRFQGRTLTFGELDAGSNHVAHAFRRLGLQHGDRVGFYLNNSVELILAYLANLKLGLLTVPMNTQYRDREITHIVNDAAPRIIFTDRDQSRILQPIRNQLPSVEHVLVADEMATNADTTAEKLEGDSLEPTEVRVDDDDLAAIMYTSGTTGRAKGAMLTHGNFVSNITGLASAWHWSGDDTLLLTLPLFHTHGLGVALHGMLTTGCTTVLHRSFRAGDVLDELLGGNITLFMGVPTMYVRLIEEAKRRQLERISLPNMRLFVCGSAPLGVETFQSFETIFQHRVLERYGMTETVMNLSNLYAGPRIPGSVGVPLPGVSARIADEHGDALSDGEIGDALIRGSNVFQGYWRAPEKTAEAFITDSEGVRWFRTGDLGKCDPANGFYTLVGRKHDLIISGGFNIYPREVEELLLQHPAVLEAAVVGAPDQAKGEIPIAFVVMRERQAARAEELIEFCSAHLARYKVPWRVTFLDALPRNAMGKVEKKKLAQE